ncbi:MAG: hypothetical protein R3310_04385 [Candidatus Competibacteraceae bacterium]|nr:hypothetical protein [Candidatus Competibacteraceae bacterium]
MSDVLVAKGPGIEVLRYVTHYAYFFGHYDADLEDQEIESRETFDAYTLRWPTGSIVLRIMHRIVRVRRIWDEEFPGDVQGLKSHRIYLAPGVQVVRTMKELKSQKNLRDPRGAERFMEHSNIQAILVHPEHKGWAKLRQGEEIVGRG